MPELLYILTDASSVLSCWLVREQGAKFSSWGIAQAPLQGPWQNRNEIVQ